jgi:hypothetical protein
MTDSFVTPSQPLPDLTCPLCGGPNGCAPAISGDFNSACWCTETKITPELLARVPEALRGKSCICKACATGQ